VTSLAVSTIGLILLVIGGLFLLLAIGGYFAAERRQRERERELLAQLQAADRELAQAHASDKGWERSALEAAARQAVAERFGEDADVQFVVDNSTATYGYNLSIRAVLPAGISYVAGSSNPSAIEPVAFANSPALRSRGRVGRRAVAGQPPASRGGLAPSP